MRESQLEKRVRELENRLHKLESKAFTEKASERTTPKDYTGLTGGIRFLTDKGFFKTPKAVSEITAELKRENYYYSVQSIDRTLRRDFVSTKKILSRTKEKDVWQYVVRN